MAFGCFVLAIYHVLYNTLLFNCRYRFKTACFTLGKCVFDCFNFTFLHTCCLQKCCTEAFQPWVIVKWVINWIVYAGTIYSIYEIKKQQPELFEESEEEMSHIPIEYLLIIFSI